MDVEVHMEDRVPPMVQADREARTVEEAEEVLVVEEGSKEHLITSSRLGPAEVEEVEEEDLQPIIRINLGIRTTLL